MWGLTSFLEKKNLINFPAEFVFSIIKRMFFVFSSFSVDFFDIYTQFLLSPVSFSVG